MNNFLLVKCISSFSFIFLYVVELSFLVSKSAHLSPNSRRFRFYRHLKVGRRSEKWPKNRTKIQCFDQDFEKKDLQIATPHSPFDRFSWKFAQRYFSRVQKIWWERNFEFFIFSLFIAQKPAKMAIFAIFGTLTRYK